MNLAPWSPMMAPPLPCRNDLEADTCEHAYPRSECNGGWHLDPSMRFSEKLRYYSMLGVIDPRRVIIVGSVT